MKLSAPKQTTWRIGLVLAVIALIGKLVTIPLVTGLAFWIALAAAALPLLATSIERL